MKKIFSTWYWSAVLVPFVTTRLIWLMVAWFSQYFEPDPSFGRYIERGWFLSPKFLIDIWCRWDSRWYLSIVTGGYASNSDITHYLSNLVYFPLYPMLVKPIGLIFPGAQSSQSIYMLFGIFLSNLFFLAACGLLYKLVTKWIADEMIARRTLLLLFAFPTSFYFSCFYTESLFLFLVLASFLAGLNKKWWLAGIMGGLCTLTRPQGILLLLPLGWIYMNQYQWKPSQIRVNLAWLALVPASLMGHILYLYQKTGIFMAPLVAQKAFGRNGNLLDDTLYVLNLPSLDPKQIEMAIWFLFLGITLVAMWRMPSRLYGVYALLLLVMPVVTGTFFSSARYVLVIFPTFIMLAGLLRWKWLENAVLAICFALQILFFLGWVNYYWIS